MEQHPVPQNVTTFQFRLIGDMTLKQFGYLVGGAIIGYVCYKLPLPFIFTWPLAITSVLLGFGLAFVPVEERPMDVWILAFFKSVYSPTQYIWQKSKKPLPPEPPVKAPSKTPAQNAPAISTQVTISPNKALGPSPTKMHKPGLWETILELLSHPKPTQPKTTTVLPIKHGPTQSSPAQAPVSLKQQATPRVTVKHEDWLQALLKTPITPKGTAPVPNYRTPVTGKKIDTTKPQVPTPEEAAKAQKEEEAKQTDLAKTKKLEDKLARLEEDLKTKDISRERLLELQKQLVEALAQKEKLEQELEALKKAAQPAASAPLRQASFAQQPTNAPTVRIITPEAALRAGIPTLTTFPNVVTGIAKDYNNNLLSGVLITVRDKEDVPLRALKSNKLGQFATSLPLPNGTYYIEVEDPRGRFVFDKAQVTLTGAVMPALEIIAKSQKELDRAKLAKEIFGNENI